MITVDLFAGIGGFALAAEAVGWTPAVSCEINPFGRKVLEYYWPKAYHHDDIFTLTGDKINEEIERRGYSGDVVLTGGFPCQPYSTAGKRLGTADPRHLWPEMLRIIRELRPKYIVGENVGGIVSWDGGLVFEQVQTEMEAEGYEVQAFVLPACAVNAPHRRDRVWFVAHRTSELQQRNDNRERGNSGRENVLEKVRQADSEQPATVGEIRPTPNPRHPKPQGRDELAQGQQYARGRNPRRKFSPFGSGRIVADTESTECERTGGAWTGREGLADVHPRQLTDWTRFPTVSPIYGRNDGLSTELAGITISRHRRESIKAYGNAIVPQVAVQIFKAIIEAEKAMNP